MIAGIIRWSARNGFLVLLGTAFIVFAGIYAVRHTALDAIPDLSDTQVIVYTEYPGQAPQVIEDQVTYPLTTALLAVPRSKVVRGFSFFGVSFVYVVFEDGTDLYWARSRVLEYLNFTAKRLPEGVTPSLGPDATGVGWVYQYVVLTCWLVGCSDGCHCRCRGAGRSATRNAIAGSSRRRCSISTTTVTRPI